MQANQIYKTLVDKDQDIAALVQKLMLLLSTSQEEDAELNRFDLKDTVISMLAALTYKVK